MDISYHHNLGYDYEALARSTLPVNLKLMFLNEVASPVFTKHKIIGKASGDDGNTSIKVILVDGNTHQMITTGPEASAKVKMVLLRGDCYGSTTKEFEENIVVEWKKKKNILLGDLYVDLHRGCGTVGDIRIKHDKNSLKNVKFRLGAMVVDSSYEVKEAITDPFEVKDHRNFPKYLRPLSLEDRVGKMMNISSKGTGKIRTRLESKNIRTVRDFLDIYSSNPQELQEICRIKGKRWEMTVKHAKTSLIGNVGTKFSSQDSSTLTSDDGSIVFANNYCYKPQPCEDDQSSVPMIEDLNFSTEDVEVCDAYFNMLEPCESNEEDRRNGALAGNSLEGNSTVKAKRRWMKLRLLSFSIVTFTKKLGLGRCGCVRGLRV